MTGASRDVSVHDAIQELQVQLHQQVGRVGVHVEEEGIFQLLQGKRRRGEEEEGRQEEGREEGRGEGGEGGGEGGRNMRGEGGRRGGERKEGGRGGREGNEEHGWSRVMRSMVGEGREGVIT